MQMNIRSNRLFALPLVALCGLGVVHAEGAKKKAAAKPAAAPAAKPKPDTIVFTNGDTLTGTLTRETGGTVTFHSDVVGDVNVSWDKIKELHSSQTFAVIDKDHPITKKTTEAQIPVGVLAVSGGKIELTPAASQATIAPIPVANATFVVDKASLDKQMLHSPKFFQAWNGTATAGLTIVKATENQYTVNSAVTLARTVPTVSWLPPRNRTTVDWSESYGKQDQPAYISGGVVVPEAITKTNILHGDAERDEYFKPRLYYLGNLAIDHNYSLDLQIQQIYGLGVGWTALKTKKTELDLKGTLQYEEQKFFQGSGDTDQNLIGSTISANYTATLPMKIAFNQQLSYIPAFNNPNAYSANETDTFTLPTYKNLGVTFGSIDTYLNDVTATEPPTKRNSFQLTFGVTYTMKSKY